MAASVGINADQGFILATVHQSAEHAHVGQFFALAPFNVPSKNVAATQAAFSMTVRSIHSVRATQISQFVVCKGRTQNPNIRVFTFTLHGHDFYVIRLGDTETLIYDVYSQQWIEWTSKDLPFWRANTGCNWVGAQQLAYQYGSDVVVGDDVWGLLYFLNPEQPFDDSPDYLNAAQQLDFERIVMGQVLANGREAFPCYVLFLSGDNYGFSANDFTPFVRLDYSDDQGQTFDSADTITAQPDTDDFDYRWYSLGQITNPGRLFRIVDNGILTRIDSLQMNDE